MNFATLQILVVEDHGFQRAALLKMLARLGATRLLEATDGDSALQVLRTAAGPVDIVISDLDMPGMDGLEFIRRLGGVARPPAVIAVSALDPAVLAAVDSMAGAYGVPLLGVLAKPLSPLKLQELLARYQPARGDATPPASGPRPTAGELQAALAGGQFEAFFQPQVELASRRVRGFEALARWRHPHAGLLMPAAFLPGLEEHGLVDQLTVAMLQQAAVCCGRWRGQGRDLSVSVNLSVTSLADVRLAERLTAIVAAQGLEPRHITLEVTESATAGSGLGAMLENLARLRLKGFGLSIDDFGTGYSSVQQLGRVAFTELKIDRSFVRDAAAREASMVILQSSLQMAQRLKLVSVAEGVETADQWRLLRRLGCDLGQGFRIAPALAPQEVPAWIEAWNQGSDGSAR